MPAPIPRPAEVADPAAELAARLRARGLRMTPQREQVLSAVRRLGHATPEQIGDAVPGADLTTVYRTLELLEQLGLVNHSHFSHGAPSYRIVGDDHIHVVCHQCGSVVDMPSELIDDVERRLREEQGFVLDRAHLTLFGTCARCAAEQIPSPGR